MSEVDYNRGYADGKNSAGMNNPIHNNWSRNKSNMVVHSNKEYVKGYVEGFKIASGGLVPLCLTNVEVIK